MPNEDARWFQRASMYFALGAARSVRAVYNAELVARGKPSEHSKPVPSSWSQASKRYEWQRRAAAFDGWRRKQVFSSGNAQDTERIKKLSELIDRLCERCMAMLAKEDAEPFFSVDGAAKLVNALLAAIDLMAKHTGGYAAQRIEHTGKDGGAIEVEETKLNVVIYMPEVDSLEIVDGENAGQISEVPDDGGGQG